MHSTHETAPGQAPTDQNKQHRGRSLVYRPRCCLIAKGGNYRIGTPSRCKAAASSTLNRCRSAASRSSPEMDGASRVGGAAKLICPLREALGFLNGPQTAKVTPGTWTLKKRV